MRTSQSVFVVGALLFVCGLGFVVVGAREARRAPAAAAAPALKAIATTKQLMSGVIDPGATAVFDSVSTSATEQGIVEVAPKDDAEWALLGSKAAGIAEAGNLLMGGGRAIDQGDWIKMSQAMVTAAVQTVKAAEMKNKDGVLDAGSALNLSCDNCHMRYRRQ